MGGRSPLMRDMAAEMTRLDDEKERVKSYAASLGERLESAEAESEGLPLETLSKLQQLRAFELEMLHQTSTLERRLDAIERDSLCREEGGGRGVAMENERLEADVARLELQKESFGDYVAGLGRRLQALPQVNGHAHSASSELRERLQTLRAFALEMLSDVSFLEKQLEGDTQMDGELKLFQAILSSKSVDAPLATVAVDVDHDGTPDMFVTGVDLNHDGVPDVLQQETNGTICDAEPPLLLNLGGISWAVKRAVKGENIHVQQRLELLLGAKAKTGAHSPLSPLPEAGSSRRSSAASSEEYCSAAGLGAGLAVFMESSSRRSSKSSMDDNREGLAGLMRRSIEIQQSLITEGLLGKTSPLHLSSLSSAEDEHESMAGFLRRSVQFQDGFALPLSPLEENHEVNRETCQGSLDVPRPQCVHPGPRTASCGRTSELEDPFTACAEPADAVQPVVEGENKVDALRQKVRLSLTRASMNGCLQRELEQITERLQAQHVLPNQEGRSSMEDVREQMSRLQAKTQEREAAWQAAEARREASPQRRELEASLQHQTVASQRVQEVPPASLQDMGAFIKAQTDATEQLSATALQLQQACGKLVGLASGELTPKADIETKMQGEDQRLRKLKASRKQLHTLREEFAENVTSLEKDQLAFEAELAAIRARGRRALSNPR